MMKSTLTKKTTDMRRILFVIGLFVMGQCLPLNAQMAETDKNTVFNLYISEPCYTKPETKKSTLDKLGSALLDVMKEYTLKERKEFVPEVGTAIRRGTNGLYRLIVKDGGFPADVQEGDLLLSIEVTSIGTAISLKEKATPYDNYAYVRATVTLTDLVHNEVIGAKQFANEMNGCTLDPLVEKALSESIDHFAKDVHKFLQSLFPVYGEILEKGLQKREKLKQVYINVGTDFGVYRGQQFYVYKVGNVAGRQTKTEIGRVKVEEVQGDDISLCKVTKGGDVIKTVLESNGRLLLMSR